MARHRQQKRHDDVHGTYDSQWTQNPFQVRKPASRGKRCLRLVNKPRIDDDLGSVINALCFDQDDHLLVLPGLKRPCQKTTLML